MSEYNGWSNWETWDAWNWLTADDIVGVESAEYVQAHQQGLHMAACDRVGTHDARPQTWLRAYVETMMTEPEGIARDGLLWDYVTACLERVDWEELAAEFTD